MQTTRYINTPSYGGKEHFTVEGSLASFLACHIDTYSCTETYTIADLFLEIAWREVTKLNPNLYGPAFAYELRNPITGYIEITFYRRK